MKAVLTYHSIDDSGSVVSVPEGVFRSHVDWLASGSVRVVHLEELIRLEDPSVDAVAVTFDDGLASFGSIAAPLLIDAGVPVTVFVVPSLVGDQGRWAGGLGGAPVLALMDWPMLRSLAGHPSIRLGAHTMTHPMLPCLDNEELEFEVVGSADEIEREAGRRPTSFAYPYGELDDRAVAAAARTFDVSVTTRLDFVGKTPDRSLLPRLDMWYFREAGALDAWGSLRFRWSVRLRRHARAVRRAVRGSPCG